MLGAIAGDIVGSIYEHRNIRTKDFPLFGPGVRFTDDTVCTAAVADCLLNDGDFAGYLRAYARRYPDAGYGQMFFIWAMTDGHPAYGSWGNGAAMRASPVAHAAADLDTVLELARRTAAVSHNHPEGIKGAQAVAAAIRLGLDGLPPGDIRQAIQQRFGYDLSESVDAIRARYSFDISCQGTVPPALVCALDATDFEDALRNAISIGGDSDTIACITGGLAEVLYGLPDWIAAETRIRLDDTLLRVTDRFTATYGRRMQ